MNRRKYATVFLKNFYELNIWIHGSSSRSKQCVFYYTLTFSAAPGPCLISSLVGHGKGRLLRRTIIKRKRELTDESKSVSSLFMNNEKMLPFRCHRGHQTLENPVIPGFFGPLKLFPLVAGTLMLNNFV